MRARDTPFHAKSQEIVILILCQPRRNRHNFFTEFIAPNLSCPQAQRWKSAKTKTPTRRSSTRREPAHHQHGRSSGGTPRNRWNDAVTTASAYSRRPWRTAIHTWSPSADCGAARAFGWCPADDAFRHGRVLPEAWLPTESNKGASEGLSAWKGKSTRVRRESSSKAPKNGSQVA